MLKDILTKPGSFHKGKHDKVVAALFAYLFNKIDLRYFIDYVVDNNHVPNRKEAVRIKDAARTNGYVLKNCKLYAWACHTARRDGHKRPSPEAFEVAHEDALLLRRLNLKHLDAHVKDPFPAYSVRSFDRMVQSLIAGPELRNYIGRFVTKKMSFLMNSYGETRHDIETMLQEMAIVALYKQYPRFSSVIHMVNVAKAQIHNKGHSFITSSTSKSRQKLRRNDDGSFEAVHVDIANLNDVEAPAAHGQELRERLLSLTKIEHRIPPRTKEFLLCAAGVHHEGFSEFLDQSNETLADKMEYGKYMGKVQEYFETTPQRVERLFTNLRSTIYDSV